MFCLISVLLSIPLISAFSMIHIMPLFLAVLAIVIACYMAYRRIRFRSCKRVQNSAARLVFQESKFCHITPFLRALPWLPVANRIVFKILLLTFKAIHKLAPNYISERVSLKDTGGRYYLRSNDGKLLNIPSCKSLSTLGDRSFYMAAPKLWNDLPLFIRNISSVNAFKKALKTHLFQ